MSRFGRWLGQLRLKAAARCLGAKVGFSPRSSESGPSALGPNAASQQCASYRSSFGPYLHPKSGHAREQARLHVAPHVDAATNVM